MIVTVFVVIFQGSKEASTALCKCVCLLSSCYICYVCRRLPFWRLSNWDWWYGSRWCVQASDLDV